MSDLFSRTKVCYLHLADENSKKRIRELLEEIKQHEDIMNMKRGELENLINDVCGDLDNPSF